jgi:hypothetical protein
MDIKKLVGLGALALLLVGCATNPDGPKNSVLRSVDLYEQNSFQEVWTAVVEVLDELEYEVRKESLDKGFIDALCFIETESGREQTLLNIIIQDENGSVRVDCLVVTPNGAEGPGRTRTAVSEFYQALNKKLDA